MPWSFIRGEIGVVRVNTWGYKLKAVDERGEPLPPSTSKRGAYRAMLTEFLVSSDKRAEVFYGKRNPQAIYMGLRQARLADSPKFDGVDISRDSSDPKRVRVFLAK